MATRKKKSRQLLSTKEYRTLYRKARDAGLVRDKGDARSYVPTAYSKKRLRDISKYLNKDVYGVVKPSKKIADQYKERFETGSGFLRVFNGRVVLPKNSGQYAALQQGLPVVITPLSDGEYEEIILPITWRTVDELREIISTHPEYDAILKADRTESFRFALGEGEPGNVAAPSHKSFQSLEDLLTDLEAYDSIAEADLNDDIEVNQWLKIYRERKDWKFPEYREELRTNQVKRYRQIKRKYRDNLSEEQKERIRKRRNELRRLAPRSDKEKLKKERKENTPAIEEIRRKDRERKKKQRDARRAKGLPREPR